jgi:hypothetical protein
MENYCPNCNETIKTNASICPYCKTKLVSRNNKLSGTSIASLIFGLLAIIPAIYGLFAYISFALIEKLEDPAFNTMLVGYGVFSVVFSAIAITLGIIDFKNIKRGRIMNIAGFVLGALAILIVIFIIGSNFV